MACYRDWDKLLQFWEVAHGDFTPFTLDNKSGWMDDYSPMFCLTFLFFNFTFIFSLSVYEKVTRGERMRTEISQAKKEANFYAQNVEKGKVIEAKKRKGTYQV